MNVDTISLYSKDASGRMRIWSIYCEDWEIFMEYGALDGEVQEQYEYIEEGKGGRTREEQVHSRINSRISKKLDKGYKRTIEEAQVRTNALGLLKPMLATPMKHVKGFNAEECFYQYKYNGHRCLITNHNGVNIAYSRNGKIIDTIPEILASLKIPEGSTLDGELYCHGYKLQTISSWVKRRQENTKKLKFVCYDFISAQCYEERIEEIKSIRNESEWLYIAPTRSMEGVDLPLLLGEALNEKYEGIILRRPNFAYEDGKRSKGLVKVKKFIDDEFRVIGVESSSDGWAVLICVTKDGKKFRVSSPGNIAEKTYVLKNYKRFVGMMIRVEFAEYTAAKIPFHPIATNWRDKESE